MTRRAWLTLLTVSICFCFASNADAAPPAKHVVFVIGEREYKTNETLPPFAKEELTEKLGWKCTFRFADPKDRNQISGLEVLKSADLLVLSVRRRAFPADQFKHIRTYLEAGKPLVGIRTASHAFDTKGNAPAGHTEWTKFDPEVLGGNYHGHYGASDKPTIRLAAGAKESPILEGIEGISFQAGGSLYQVSPLAKRCKPLLTGSIEGKDPEPVAWTTTYRKGRVFYTSLGHPDDFKSPAFRKLLRNAIVWATDEPSAK
jgi:type 1 glutamine amidotransferase